VALTSGVPAHAVQSSGTACQLASTPDSTAGGDVQTGAVWGGPLTVQDDAGNPTTATLYCFVQVNDPIPSGGHPGVAGHGTGVVTAGPAQVSFVATPDDSVYVCSALTSDADGATYYLDDTTRAWSLTPAPCTLVVAVDGTRGNVALIPPYPPPPPPPPPVPASGAVQIHNFPPSAPSGIVGAKLLYVPPAWSCVDVHSRAPVSTGAFLQVPDPGVECTPPAIAAADCLDVEAGGYHSDISLGGSLRVVSECTGLQASATMATPFWTQVSTPVTGSGTMPWTCRVDESGLASPRGTDYWVFCRVN
jgi:hypothetical protein